MWNYITGRNRGLSEQWVGEGPGRLYIRRRQQKNRRVSSSFLFFFFSQTCSSQFVRHLFGCLFVFCCCFFFSPTGSVVPVRFGDFYPVVILNTWSLLVLETGFWCFLACWQVRRFLFFFIIIFLSSRFFFPLKKSKKKTNKKQKQLDVRMNACIPEFNQSGKAMQENWAASGFWISLSLSLDPRVVSWVNTLNFTVIHRTVITRSCYKVPSGSERAASNICFL